MSIEISKLSEVVKNLKELQCCARCILRYIGKRDSSAAFYAKPYNEIVNYVEDTYSGLFIKKDVENSWDFICILCLGLLQPSTSHALITKICDLVKSSDHEFFNFTTAITYPLVLTFRHHSLWMHLKENFSSIYPEQVSLQDTLRLKDCIKFVYGPQMELNLDVEFYKKSPFSISVILDHSEAMKELDFLVSGKRVLKCHPRKRKKVIASEPFVTAMQLTKCIENIETCQQFREIGNCPPQAIQIPCRIAKVECTNAPVYLAGRYNKYSRFLSQSPWIVNGQRMTENSVEELIAAEIEKVFLSDDSKFSSAGREDVDVRMLGKGRPFILELINPRKIAQNLEQIKKLQMKVNSSTDDIKIRDLQKISREECGKLKEAEKSKTKTYRALVYVSEGVTEEELFSLNDNKDIMLNQKTPLRVLHRRPLADRQRKILTMSTEYIDKNHFYLYLCTEAGTYIKEFVHGDFGRTQPNLSTIMNKETDILELDVMVRCISTSCSQ
ncbi:tRNA pseudouridine synthase Pus10-like [Xenia sp. Carnegie-2017]|uniref:tRNA pseudouridine synthase Pus10-like n=1 Tax=Xenia sp. Carnegie-2017 TaxID=2897299 RepID=UPI001F03F4CB|nr:tRNA pseudouridine synthase Pus10-like [Xenia sp. Carnegie-2017]